MFGRVNAPWPFFPASAVPRWVSEGLATWYESELTDAGRVRGTYHDMVLRTAALEGRFESIGQAAGGSPQWPEGTRAYAYGSLFFEHLLDKYGDERMTSSSKLWPGSGSRIGWTPQGEARSACRCPMSGLHGRSGSV